MCNSSSLSYKIYFPTIIIIIYLIHEPEKLRSPYITGEYICTRTYFDISILTNERDNIISQNQLDIQDCGARVAPWWFPRMAEKPRG
jgi:hypothetical protein